MSHCPNLVLVSWVETLCLCSASQLPVELGTDELMMLVEVVHGHGDSDGTA